MPQYKTQEYAKPTVKTSQIPAEGIDIVYRGIRSTMTKFNKDMYLVDCLVEGRETDLLFNSVKLAKLFTEHEAEFVGKTLHITPFGSGPQREYTVDTV
ncbi:MAG: hypothetical protein A2Z74_04665 [Chloroflexi bacterium RBG_13_46_9]|nr:MAG: hypothetical protein A2Z74_04665 [Chloroflexi bacterium RBG_13_46_9]